MADEVVHYHGISRKQLRDQHPLDERLKYVACDRRVDGGRADDAADPSAGMSVVVCQWP